MLEEITSEHCNSVPWDIRWLPTTAVLCRHTDQLNCSICFAANKLSLLLYFRLKKIQSSILTGELNVGQKNSLTVEEYSTALMHGTMSDDVTSDPVVTRFSSLLHVFDQCLEAALKCKNTSLDTAQCSSLQDSLDWRFRFAQLGALPLTSDEENESDRRARAIVIDETISKLTVHYNWFSKWTFPKLQFLLEQDSTLKNSVVSKQFESIVKEIQSSIAVSLSVLIPIGKKMKLAMGQPLPHTDTQQIELLDQMQRFSNIMNLWQLSSFTHIRECKAVVGFLQTKMGFKSRLDIAFAFGQIFQDPVPDQVIGVIRETEQTCREAGFIEACSDKYPDGRETPSTMKVAHNNSAVELWPLQDLMCLLLSGTLKKSLLLNVLAMNFAKEKDANTDIAVALRISHPSLQDIAKNLSSFMLSVPSIPPMYLALVKILDKSDDLLTSLSSDSFKNVIPSLMIMMLQHSQFSPSVRHMKEWISWTKQVDIGSDESATQMDWLGTDVTREESIPLHCPVMTNLVTSFVMQNSHGDDLGATLCSQKSQIMQLSVIKEVLWKNMIVLSTPVLNYILNDAHSAQTYFQMFIQSLQTVVGNVSTALPDLQVEAIIKVLSDNSGRISGETEREGKLFADILKILAGTVMRLKKMLTTFAKDKSRSCETGTKDNHILVATAEIWTLIGLLQTMMYGNVGLIDPVEKKKLKFQHISEEVEDTENMLYAHDLQSCVCSRSLNEFDDCNMHPYIILLRGKLDHLVTRHKAFKKCVAERPKPSLFDGLAKEALHYSRSISSPDVILGMHKNMVTLIKKLSEQDFDENEKIILLNRAEEVLKEEKIWEESQQMFCDRFNKKYSKWYPDMVTPLISASAQLHYGMQNLATLLQKQVIRTKVMHKEGIVDNLMHNLVCFPSTQKSVLSLVNTFTSEDTFSVVSKALEGNSNSEQLRKEMYRLLKSSLEELKNFVMVKGDLQPDIWASFEELLGQIVHAWRQQEDERKQKEREKESLFVTKDSTKTLTEEAEMVAELEELFPSSSTDDFGDLQQQATLEQIPIRKNTQEEVVIGLVTPEDMDYVCQLHSHIVQSYTNSAWLPSIGNRKYSDLRPDFVQPLLERFKTFGVLLDKLSIALNSSLDTKLYPSLSMLVSIMLNITDKGRTKFSDAGNLAVPSSPARHVKPLSSQPPEERGIFDFYKERDVKEVKQCLPLLISLSMRVKELLAEWPEHPTLQQMLTIIERILNFPLTSPLARFMSGLEILLDKMHEWEENAHSGVSLAAHWKAVTDQIGTWRKLELQCWNYYLDNVAIKTKRSASKWWFYVYSLVESCVSREKTGNEEIHSSEELIKTLQKFMEQSTLGEFEARLNILFSFHCHVVHLPQTTQRDELMNILWNVYSYYFQFCEAIASKIKELRAPIEKKLKDCVKIFRWNDISHWAIKEAIKKVHRTLHKYIKEFQEVLNQPVKEALTNPSSKEEEEINVSAWDRRQRHQPRMYQRLLEPMNFVSNLRIKKVGTEAEKEGSLLKRAGNLHIKARKLCRKTIICTPYARYIQSVDGLVTEVVETSSRLRNLSVPEDVSKAKRRSQLKSFLQQKQKALADLFRTLQQMGLSYRTGLTYWNVGETSLVEFTLPPLELRASFQHLKNRRIDALLLSLWDGSETYFLRSIARLALLNASLQLPAKDLGLPTIERCRGFATHLMILSREQKQSLCESTQLLFSLRCHVAQLTALEDTDVLLPKQSTLQDWHIRLKEMLVTAIICLEQFRLFLYCCPSDDDEHITSDCHVPVMELPGMKCPSIVQVTKGDAIWNSTAEKVKTLITSLSKLKCSIEKCELVPSNLYTAKNSSSESNGFVARPLCELIEDGYAQIELSMKKINELKVVFENSYKPEQCFVRVELVTDVPEETHDDHSFNPMTQSLNWLQNVMEREVKEFNAFMKKNKAATCVKFENDISLETDVEGPIVTKFREDTEKFLKSILLVVQEIYKKYTLNGDMSVVNDEEMTEIGNDGIDKGNVANDQEKEEIHNEKQNKGNAEDGDEEETKIEDDHLKEKLIGSLTNTLSVLQMKKISDELNELLERIKNTLDLENGIREGNMCKRLLLCCLPCLDQLVLLYQFFVTLQVAAYRVSCKLLSVLLAIFIELAQKGFCQPQEVTADEGSSQTESKAGGMGLGEGEGEKDISEQIESEEQLEEARPKGEEKTDDDKECKEEEKGIEMTEDFEGKVQDLDKKEDEDDNLDKDDNDEEELDKEMGETETGADTLDQQIWGSDTEEEGEGEQEEEKEEERGSGEKVGTPELGADENQEKPDEDEDHEKHEQKKKDINEMEDGDENEDQIDPYHGKQEPQPEPEPLDLPEDLQLDDGIEKKEGEDVEEENPFDIDKMKEQKPQEQENKEEEEEEILEDKEGIDNPSDEEMEVEEIKEEQEKMEEENESMEEERTGGGSKNEEKSEEEPKLEPEKEVEEKAEPSADVPSHTPAEAATEMEEAAFGSKDQVKPDKDSEAKQQPMEESVTEGNDDKQGVGQAQTEEADSGHQGQMTELQENIHAANLPQEKRNEKRQHFEESDNNRSLGEVTEPLKKKLKTMNLTSEEEVQQDNKDEDDEGVKHEEDAPMYQHIKEANKSIDVQTLDAATEEQAKQQPVPNLENEEGEDMKDDDIVEIQSESEPEESEAPKLNAEKVTSDKHVNEKEKEEKTVGEKVNEGGDIEMVVEVEGEKVETIGAARGNETTFHTVFTEVEMAASHQDMLSMDDHQALRSQLENQLATWSQPPPDGEAEKTWEMFSTVTAGLARDLSEQLRLVLEPTQASRLRGDYRTGRRINMRKVIPYIASQFRKDKIWLRRTKPSKREYQIVLAIDDSSSMADNHSKELAFESLALVSRALTLLEAGELSVVSFGESTRVLHKLGDLFTEQSGARLLQQFSFEQKNTRVGQLVDFVTTMFMSNRTRATSTIERAQLLVIVSDGRIISEAADKVKQAVRRARHNGIFMVFLIIDNPESKDSILDIQQPVFIDNKCVGFSPYLDNFPFPFYLILRDINALPTVLSDALRQWFELVTNMDN